MNPNTDLQLSLLVAEFEAMKDNTEARAGATLMLGKAGPGAVPHLLKALHDPEGIVRAFAARSLGQFRDSAVLDELMSLMNDSDGGVRYEAVQALGRIGDPKAAAPIATRLTDPEEAVRSKAISVLEELGDRQSLEPLLDSLNDTAWEIRCEAVKAVVTLATSSDAAVDDTVLQPLIGLLSDPRPEVRQSTAFGLSLLKEPGAVGDLIPLLSDDNPAVRKNAHHALTTITGEDFGMDPTRWKDWHSSS